MACCLMYTLSAVSFSIWMRIGCASLCCCLDVHCRHVSVQSFFVVWMCIVGISLLSRFYASRFRVPLKASSVVAAQHAGLVANSLCLLWSSWLQVALVFSVLVGHWHTTVLQQCVYGFGQPQVALQSVFHYQRLLLLFLFLVFYSLWRKVLQYFAIPQTEEFHTVACLSLPVRSRIDCSRFLHP